jgi:hypothetical protein
MPAEGEPAGLPVAVACGAAVLADPEDVMEPAGAELAARATASAPGLPPDGPPTFDATAGW